jgi:hypothetical protein
VRSAMGIPRKIHFLDVIIRHWRTAVNSPCARMFAVKPFDSLVMRTRKLAKIAGGRPIPVEKLTRLLAANASFPRQLVLKLLFRSFPEFAQGILENFQVDPLSETSRLRR